jgi:hypothetical protein
MFFKIIVSFGGVFFYTPQKITMTLDSQKYLSWFESENEMQTIL